MYFCLDIHYSDTWGDVTHQAIPASWGMSASTPTEDLAAKVSSYTTEVLTTLKEYGATPDYVQVGNEVSYGMLWDTCTYDGTTINMSSTSKSCHPGSYTDNWARFAALMSAGCKAVRATCPNAKIIIHTERTANATYSVNIYDFLTQGGLSTDDWDIIGLSYYPWWHNTLSQLGTTISALNSRYPTKEIQVMETAWVNKDEGFPEDATYASSLFSWAHSPEGQAAFLTDLISTLKEYNNVSGLYYWQPEELGNAADDAGNSRVMNDWANRGFWELSWKTQGHSLISKDAMLKLYTFVTDQAPVDDRVQVSIANGDFETENLDGWTATWNILGNMWPTSYSTWEKISGGSYYLNLWSSNVATASNLIEQTVTAPATGTYVVRCDAAANLSSFYLFANDKKQKIQSWTNNDASLGTSFAVGVFLEKGETLKFGLSTETSDSEVFGYCDNFEVFYLPAPLPSYDMNDVNNIVQYLLGKTPDDFDEKAADVNGDGEIGMPDIMFIVNYILNGKFPDKE
jgi:arabinogalactan endo-1,4-beta-galactosidase